MVIEFPGVSCLWQHCFIRSSTSTLAECLMGVGYISSCQPRIEQRSHPASHVSSNVIIPPATSRATQSSRQPRLEQHCHPASQGLSNAVIPPATARATLSSRQPRLEQHCHPASQGSSNAVIPQTRLEQRSHPASQGSSNAVIPPATARATLSSRQPRLEQRSLHNGISKNAEDAVINLQLPEMQ